MPRSSAKPVHSAHWRTQIGWGRIRTFLFPHFAERDPEFRREIERLSVRSLYVIAAVCAAMPLLDYLFQIFTTLFEPYPADSSLWSILALFVLAVLLVLAARSRWGRKRARLIALLSGVTAAGILIWGQFLGNPVPEQAALNSLMDIVIVQLVAVAAVPALPWQIFALGAAIGWFHWFSAKLAVYWELIPQVSLHHYAGMDLVTLLCTGLAAVSYQRLYEEHSSHLRETEAQSRLLISDHAASMGRFAATLSHELNTPIGALVSAVDSLRTLEARKAQTPAAEPEPLARVKRELYEAAESSARQLESVLARMRRFTNLDRSDTTPVDLSRLLGDVVAMVEPDAGGAPRIDLDCESMPLLMVRPQQISAVFSNLINHAVASTGADGHVAVLARRQNGLVKVIVRDEGPGYSPAELAQFFEPVFKVVTGRVVGGNWGMFSSRQVVRQHGGDVEVRSVPGQGTEVAVTLPVDVEPA